MPEKLQNLSEKVIHIKSNSVEPDRQVSVKYLSEIISARVEEIIMAILYEIHTSGFADMLRSGIVITGGGAQIANLGNFIYDISGYRVRTGYPKSLFSCQGCDDIMETTAATSIGLLNAAKEEQALNCAVTGDQIPAQIQTETPQTESAEPIAEAPAPSTIFPDDAFEKVEKREEKKEPKKDRSAHVMWKKITQFCGNLYESVNDETI